MLSRFLEQENKRRTERRRQLALLLCLSILVLLEVYIGMRRNGIALSDSQLLLVCPYMDEGAEPVAHTHDASCFGQEGELICTLPEREAHLHTDDCYREEATLICDREENPGHVHEDSCYEEKKILNCSLEESPGHQHTDACFSEGGEEPGCGLEEGEGAHQHSEECYQLDQTLICGLETGEGAHVHDESCYQTERVLSCMEEELPPHVHGENCFRVSQAEEKQNGQNPEGKNEAVSKEKKPEDEAKNTEKKQDESDWQEEEEEELPEKPVSDPTADLETSELWEKAFEKLKLTGEWSEDLIAVAETQFGYTESELNFDAILNEARDGYVLKGWTRYGAWYGIPYGDWCAMFVSFCLHYADISNEDFPYDCGTTTWVRQLNERGLFSEASEYSPMPGDLIFFDWEQDGLSDHVGLVYGADKRDNYLLTIEGNHTKTVQTFEYAMNDPRIMGYGTLSQVERQEELASEETEQSDLTEKVESESIPVSPTEEVLKPVQEAGEARGTDEEKLAAEPKPAQRFDQTVAGIRVQVEADEGAFPENTYMSLAPINGNFLKDTLAGEIDGEILEIQAVDIVFVNEYGEELEPAIPIRVSITVQETQFSDRETEVVHLNNDGNPTIIPQAEERESSSNCEILFDAESFTPYAVVRKAESLSPVMSTENTEDSIKPEEEESLLPETLEAQEPEPAPEDDHADTQNVSTLLQKEEETLSIETSDKDTESTEDRTAPGFVTNDREPVLSERMDPVREENRRIPEAAYPIMGQRADMGYWTILSLFSVLVVFGSLWLLEKSREKDFPSPKK